MAPCECSKGEACCLISTGRPPIRCSLIIPHPLGLEIGPQTTRKNFRLPVFLWSLGWLVYSAAFAAEGLPVFQAIWIARQACARRTSQLVFRRVSVVTCATLFRSSRAFALHDLRTRLEPNGSSCLDLSDNSVPEFLIPGEPGFSSGGAAMIDHRLLPGFPGMSSADRQPQNPLRLAPCAGLRFPHRNQQNAFAICSNNPLFRAAARVFLFGNIGSVTVAVSSTTATGYRLAPEAPARRLRCESSELRLRAHRNLRTQC